MRLLSSSVPARLTSNSLTGQRPALRIPTPTYTSRTADLPNTEADTYLSTVCSAAAWRCLLASFDICLALEPSLQSRAPLRLRAAELWQNAWNTATSDRVRATAPLSESHNLDVCLGLHEVAADRRVTFKFRLLVQFGREVGPQGCTVVATERRYIQVRCLTNSYLDAGSHQLSRM